MSGLRHSATRSHSRDEVVAVGGDEIGARDLRRSAPAQKAFSEPVMTTAPISWSVSNSASASLRSATSPRDSAFSAFGRLSGISPHLAARLDQDVFVGHRALRTVNLLGLEVALRSTSA